MSKKIRHIVHLSSADIWRGAEQQIIYLYDGIKNIAPRQTIICSQNGILAQYCQKQGYEHLTYKRESGFNWNLVQKIKDLHSSHPIDVIHIHDPHAHHAYITAYLLGCKVPAILHRRVDFATANNFFSKWKYEFPGIKKIVCVSHQVKKILDQSKKMEEKTIVLHDCIQIEKFHKINGRKILEKDYPAIKDKYVVGNVAALVDHKDHHTFIKAAYHLTKVLQVKDIHFLIIGQGELKENLQQLIIEYNLQEVVTMIGQRNDIPDILNGLDLYTFTSKMEGFGSTILEVMSAKVPIIATLVGGPKEILCHKGDALLIKKGDYVSLAHQIDLLKNDLQLSKRLVNNAYQKVQSYSVQQYVLQIKDIYQQIL